MPGAIKSMIRRQNLYKRVLVIASTFLVGAIVGCSPTVSPGHDQYQQLIQELPELRAERTQSAVDCLAEAGFPGATVGEGGTTQLDVPPEQFDAYDVAANACMKTICPSCGEAVPQSEWEWLYQMLVQARQCLMEHDYEVSEPPSLQVYLDAAPEDSWSPFREVGPRLATDYTTQQACPDPEAMLSYGNE